MYRVLRAIFVFMFLPSGTLLATKPPHTGYFECIEHAIEETGGLEFVEDELRADWFCAFSPSQMSVFSKTACAEFLRIVSALDLLAPKPEIAQGRLLALHRGVQSLIRALAEKMESRQVALELDAARESQQTQLSAAGPSLAALRLARVEQREEALEEAAVRTNAEALIALRRIIKTLRSFVHGPLKDLSGVVIDQIPEVQRLASRLPVVETTRFIANIIEVMRREAQEAFDALSAPGTSAAAVSGAAGVS